MDKEFVHVATKEQIQPGQMLAAWVGGRRILVYNIGGKFYATDEQCTHRQCSLAQGTLKGKEITCPCHRARFDVTTGTVLNPPATIPLPTHPIKIEGNNVLVGIETDIL